jgi:hypothetical protein
MVKTKSNIMINKFKKIGKQVVNTTFSKNPYVSETKADAIINPTIASTPTDKEQRVKKIIESMKKEHEAVKALVSKKSSASTALDNSIKPNQWYKIAPRDEDDYSQLYYLNYYKGACYIIQGVGNLSYLCISALGDGFGFLTTYEHLSFERFVMVVQATPTPYALTMSYKITQVPNTANADYPDPLDTRRAIPVWSSFTNT